MISDTPYSIKKYNIKTNSFNLELNEDGKIFFEEFLKKNMNPFNIICLSYSNIYKNAIRILGSEEINQIGRIALWKTLLTFNPNKGKLSTYLTYKVIQQTNNILKKYKSNPLTNINLSKVKKVFINKDENPLDILISKEIINNINSVISSLSDKEKQIINKRIDGKSFSEISREENVTPPTISNKFISLSKKFKQR